MKIAVIDTLIQTIDFDQPVRGGLVKSAILDVEALSCDHDVSFLYYGKPWRKGRFHAISLDSLGSKDWCLKNKKKVSMAHHKLRKDTPLMLETLSEINPDAIIIHVCSKSNYLYEIAKKFIDTPKIFMFHDGVSNDDLFGTAGILHTIVQLKKYGSFIVTNSEYTRDSITKVMIHRELDLRKFYPELMKEIKDVNTYQLFDKVYDYFVYYDPYTKPEVTDNENFSVNIGRYQKKKGVLNLLELHKQSDHIVKLFGVKDPVFDPGLKDYAKIKEHTEKHMNYILCENFSDEKLREEARRGQNVVISCPVEGFGYTAFEMGIFGMPCVIVKIGERHATEEYLKKLGASYVAINAKGNRDWKKQLYKAVEETKLTVEEKKENAKKFLDYFTLQNYINEREAFIELAKKKIKNTKTLF
jgi:glycosyltransferase involved in cell wall biosynthesis